MAVRKIRIALIEDSRTVRMFYKNLFEKVGFQVLEAENAKQGWKIICDAIPDIIVLDMLMPEIPGIELLKKIRASEKSKEIPVIVLTSVKDNDKVKEIFDSGADHYSLKGMETPESIKATVNQLLKKQQEKSVMKNLDGEETQKPENSEENADRIFVWWQ